MIKYIRDLAFGKNPYVTLQKRVLIMMMLAGILLGIVGNTINIALALPFELLIAGTIVPLILLYLVYRVVYGRKEKEYTSAVGWVLLVFFPVQWTMNGGRDSNTPTLFFFAITLLLFILPQKRLYLHAVLLSTEFILLYFVDQFLPHMIVPYTSDTQRFYDLLLGNTLYLALLIYTASVIRNSYNFQIQKGELQNKKLRELNKQLIEKEKILKQYADELEKSDRSKSRFISILSHDLRSPFQGLLGLGEILSNDLDKMDREKGKELAELLYHSLQNQYTLLNDLLMWTKVQSDSIEPEIRELKLHPVVEEVKGIFSSVCNQKDINLVNSVQADSAIRADRDMISMVLRNLVSNAIKFSNTGGKVEVLYNGGEAGSVITVSDNGTGMEPAVLEKIKLLDLGFTTPGTRGEKGTGLGLNLAYEIIRKHNGAISFQSAPGKGTVAVIELRNGHK